jgi:AcrR family transcriptional regulator
MKERIITTATNLFTRYGIKSISMGEVASELRISKRTLYEHFSDKNSLVFECVQREAENRRLLIEKAEEDISSLQVILNINKIILQQILQWSPVFSRSLNV